MPVENINKDENYEYETKCRRCGHLTQWYFSNRFGFPFSDFLFAMNDKIASPRQMECKVCLKETVQDIVSYTPYK